MSDAADAIEALRASLIFFSAANASEACFASFDPIAAASASILPCFSLNQASNFFVA